MKPSLKLSLIVLGLLLALAPLGGPETLYARVGDGSAAPTRRASELGVPSSADHVVADGELYVRRERRWGSLLFDYGRSWTWDTERIAAFRRRHPDLEPHWQERDARTDRLARLYGE